jgi:RNA polymerase sigma-70 factor (ECF subfamily)
VLASLDARQAELLLLRSNELSYAEVAAALELNPSSVGTLISRAQQAFRKEYVGRYGEPNYER